MAKPHRGSSRQPSPTTDDAKPGGTGGFAGQLALFETANGLPHGPGAIALAIAAAILLYPVTRLIRVVRNR